MKEMYCVPEDVADAYKKLKTPQFEEEKERIDTLRTYLQQCGLSLWCMHIGSDSAVL